ncbi:tryptophan 7-halogenase [Bradyrhizobium diazoefficiens]|nr:tryptophan 7-halogenase [Bradyrhizobium diazoefficiens]MBR0776401.1 tryptophan 7-halogenase [Bradyrhizobium diazoefficiens]
MQFDAIIVGAGTAGSVAALNLAPFRRVLLLEANAAPSWRIGESLPGAARHLLSDMGLLDAFVRSGHLPRHALRSAWGGPEPEIRDALASPDGHGWQIDRVVFERQMRDEASRRGAGLLSPAKVVRVERAGQGWRVRFERQGRTYRAESRLLIDAAGRGSRQLTSVAGPRHVHDKLACAWIRARNVALPAGCVQVEAEADGWWYAAPLPEQAGILAFHTDADLPAARDGRTLPLLLARARRLPMLGGLLLDSGWDHGERGYCAAQGAWLETAAGENWLAAGDAALAFDPIAAQGLFNALYLGLSAAEAAQRWFEGDGGALSGYAAEVARIRDAYVNHRAAFYRQEVRWADRRFWATRH